MVGRVCREHLAPHHRTSSLRARSTTWGRCPDMRPRTARCQPGNSASTGGPHGLQSPAMTAATGQAAVGRRAVDEPANCHSPRCVHADDVGRCDAASTVHSSADRGPAGRRVCPIGGTRRVTGKRAIASSTCPRPARSPRAPNADHHHPELDGLGGASLVRSSSRPRPSGPRHDSSTTTTSASKPRTTRATSKRSRWCAPKRPVPQWALNDASVNSVRRSACQARGVGTRQARQMPMRCANNSLWYVGSPR